MDIKTRYKGFHRIIRRTPELIHLIEYRQPTLQDWTEARYINAKIDRGYYTITPKRLYTAYKGSFDLQRVYLRKISNYGHGGGFTAEIELVGYLGAIPDALSIISSVSPAYRVKAEPYFFRHEIDGMFGDVQFDSISWRQLFPFPFNAKKGWCHG